MRQLKTILEGVTIFQVVCNGKTVGQAALALNKWTTEARSLVRIEGKPDFTDYYRDERIRQDDILQHTKFNIKHLAEKSCKNDNLASDDVYMAMIAEGFELIPAWY
jgi:hypothetical protein